MNSSEFTYLLNKPELVNADHNLEFDKILNEFPYFQSARILQLKSLHKQDSFKYNSALKLSAAYTTDRSVLFNFITTDAFLNKNKSFLEDKNTQPIEVVLNDDNTQKKDFEIKEPNIRLLNTENEIDINNIEVIQPNTLENSILASIHSATQENETENDSMKEKISWLEDSIEPENEKMISFEKNEKHSFQEWLQLAKINPIIREEFFEPKIENKVDNQINDSSNLESKIDLIDKFIESNPKISPPKDNVSPPSYIGKTEDKSYLMTETLAKIYLEQKKYAKAIQAYEILILKYPEKSSLFADRILDIKDLQQNNK